MQDIKEYIEIAKRRIKSSNANYFISNDINEERQLRILEKTVKYKKPNKRLNKCKIAKAV